MGQPYSKPVRQTLTGFFQYAEEIKRSRFTAIADSVTSSEQAADWLAAHRDAEATHNAWAWVIDGAFRFHDDGEVSGTAGKPILGAIEKQNLNRVIVLVRRIYGGIQLGAGGLTRAYGGTAATCLRLAPRRDLRRVLRCRFEIPFSEQGRVYYLFERHQIERIAEDFTDRGIAYEIRLTPERENSFRSALRDVLRGADDHWQQISDDLL